MKNVLAFIVTVFVGIGVGSCIFAIETLESETKRRFIVARDH